MFSSVDMEWMRRALQLAEHGLYTTDPNPRVGCVLVKNGAVVGEGWHEKAGEPHAEVHALRQAGEQATGATAYVTLEPCSHFGRTPPCCDALIQAAVARVVVAMQDPNPVVSGNGIGRLREAGIPVDVGCLEAEARALNPGFIKRMSLGLPYVRVKMAMSADGRTAMASGESKWITGAEARLDVQRLRARSSAIVTGIATVLTDDPALTVRQREAIGYPSHGELRQPWRVVLDSAMRMPATAALLSQPGKTVLVAAAKNDAQRQALTAAGAEVWVHADLSGDKPKIDIGALMMKLASVGCNEVLVETGPTLAGEIIGRGFADELVTYVAPKLLGSDARPAFWLPGMTRMAEAIEMHLVDLAKIGDDVRLTYHLAR
ncbi:MAG TPA: bifunctional diaminohydroxyphosphoribosylaminopyrimidine deaminase/5-amino-6-(5-phosphoribosylamino)uracil reductase RibD [Pseudomonadales bacterium]|nr:bifunctional diaminohydroxyphosphoribosylaminopyrimidine deaminase/5-amino-6-(5-phosphoribosylamino)uracil reductase RibD [Pseudomonadales bacterium]